MKTWQQLKNNPSKWKQYFVRETVLRAIRSFFYEQHFHEVETPFLTGSLPPESYLEVFETTLLSRTRVVTHAYLPTSPEPFMKKLLVAGIGNCFSLTKSFRNTETMSTTHVPEFTILEWYRVGVSYEAIMDDMEALVFYIQKILHPKSPEALSYQGKTIALESPWERLTVSQAFLRYANIPLENALTKETLAFFAQKKGYAVTESDTWEMIFNQILLNEIEPNLGKGRPTILYEYPASLAALSRKKESDPRFAERFEVYIEGIELADAYSELTDPKEQRVRFENEARERKALGKTEHPIDWDFIDALAAGMPQCGGIAVGVDRLIMLFADTKIITDTLLFPPQDLFENIQKD